MANESHQGEQTDFDVLIIGAGISGIGAAYHLAQKCPDKTWLILESRDSFGGTWDLHKYPGIRSDSDLYTFGYRFKPWMGPPIAEAHVILEYLKEVIEENQFEDRIRYGRKVRSASWSSEEQLWSLEVEDKRSGQVKTYRCNFLDLCLGYYDYYNPYTPEWKGMESFRGEIIHPMKWREDFDYRGKKVVVIGSGATAATLIPKLAEQAEHVTMLQRSPTYFIAAPNDSPVARFLKFLRLPDMWVHRIMRVFMLGLARLLHRRAQKNPEKAKAWLLKQLEKHIPREMIDQHFSPSYRPWQQRLAFIPDSDLFVAIQAGSVSVVTDRIDTFTERGIRTASGEELEADVIVTATGFHLAIAGNLPIEVDGKAVDLSEQWTHRGVMLSGLPNLIYFFGYLRTSWTMRVELLADYQCRLINHMTATGAKSVTPTVTDDERQTMPRYDFVSEDEFNPGYIRRSADSLPKSSGAYPWHFHTDYYDERKDMPKFDLDDPSLVYRK